MANDKCTTPTRNSKIKVEENGRVAVFTNEENSKFKVIEIDGCLITAGVRADYMVSKGKSVSVIVELKGKDISHACDQLFATVEHDAVKEIINPQVGFLIICRRFPRFDTFVAKAKTRSARQYKAGFHVICNKGEFDIDRVAAIDGPY
ncbi:hypothetical protein [Sphingomonas hylomeconis]|uniref:Uncharacterized protein n=1 Tax=Sphingomonas hylomeconis TaxID=1395958 RepID=A0ABV7SWC0_9SPHN|nr:hypothetical protein [Sphingomonas hylomeconis]